MELWLSQGDYKKFIKIIVNFNLIDVFQAAAAAAFSAHLA